MWKIIKLDTEITNRCNAACPQCPRTGTNNGVSDVIHSSGMRDVDPAIFDHILSSKYGFAIDKITYCGNYGDPIMHPKAMDIFQTVASYGVKYQRLDTNGGARGTDWWKELGSIPGMSCNFAIDGLEDTNHLYRVKTNWNKIMENVEAFMSTGGQADWIFIVFEHNEHQVEEAKALAEKMGFNSFKIKLSTRKFDPKKPRNPNVNEYKRKKNSETVKADLKFAKKDKYQADLVKDGLKEFPVSCMAEDTKQLFLTSDSRILPCCHVQPTVWERKFIPESHKKEPEFAFFIERQKLKTDLDNFSFDEIVESYVEVYPHFKQAWSDRSLTTCNRKCGSNFKNVVQSV